MWRDKRSKNAENGARLGRKCSGVQVAKIQGRNNPYRCFQVWYSMPSIDSSLVCGKLLVFFNPTPPRIARS